MNEIGKINLQYIIENEFYKTVPLVSANDFISYCKKRSIKISKEKLEKYEELGIFYPLARVEYPKIIIKVEYSENGKEYLELGILREGEEWSGDIEEEYSMFSFVDDAKDWFKEDLLWEPTSRDFEKWDNFVDENGYTKIESYYSIFQCYNLLILEQQTKMSLNCMDWISYDDIEIDKIIKTITSHSSNIISKQKEQVSRNKIIPLICQVLSNRYFPLTQTDGRRIKVTLHGFRSDEWDWFEYCKKWEPEKILSDLEMNSEYIKDLQSQLLHQAFFIDPIEKWYELVDFISIEKKERLKDNALLAQTIYSTEKMVRFFYQDITGEDLPSPDETYGKWKEGFYGKGVVENKLQYLEFISNIYHINPKPNLILIVEGDGEEKQIPRLASEFFGINFSTMGINIMNLQGVGNFEGKKRDDKYGALEKLIDDYHNRQTFVFLILDNEGRVLKIKEKLVSKSSRYYPSRTITKDEYIHLWNTNIEFDNFTFEEIAQSMTDLAEGKYIFSSEEIEECKKSFGKKGDPLKSLSKEKLNYEISKIDILGKLFDTIINSGAEYEEQKEKPIISVLEKIIDLARNNSYCQPNSLDHWKKNQESGFFGNPISK
jgi:hypothetical protein